MGGRGSGRPPKPAALRALHGSRLRPRHVTRRPLPAVVNLDAAKVPKAPRDLSPRAKRHWKYYAAALAQMGILAPGDVGALEAYCEALAEVDELRELRATPEYQRVLLTEGAKTHPLETQYRQWSLLARQLRGDLGLSPTTREKASQAPAPADDAAAKASDEFTAYQQRRLRRPS